MLLLIVGQASNIKENRARVSSGTGYLPPFWQLLRWQLLHEPEQPLQLHGKLRWQLLGQLLGRSCQAARKEGD